MAARGRICSPGAGKGRGEDQKVQFILYRVRRLDETELSLWFGRERLSARIVNQGQQSAAYEITVRIEGRQEGEIQSIGRKVLAPGEEWGVEVDFNFEAGVEVTEVSLYRDGRLLQKEEQQGLTLHLWIDVKGGG
jgi:hypothetical protein